MRCVVLTDVRKRTVALATVCALLIMLLVSTMSLSGDQTPLILSGIVLVAYCVHLIGVLEDRQALFHLGLYGAAYTHGMQFMYCYATNTWWHISSVAALTLAACCFAYTAYTGFTLGIMARAAAAPETKQPMHDCEDECKSDVVDYV